MLLEVVQKTSTHLLAVKEAAEEATKMPRKALTAFTTGVARLSSAFWGFLYVLFRIVLTHGGVVLGTPGAVLGVLGNPVDWPAALFKTCVRLRQVSKTDPIRQSIANVWSMMVPTLPYKPPVWLKQAFPLLTHATFGEDSTVHPPDWAEQCADDAEVWFFLNGVATTLDVAKTNALMLQELFDRKVTVIHNPTDSAIVDVLECTLGKVWDDWATDPRRVATAELKKALLENSILKVVFIAHSQGTIIASNVLEDLNKDPDLTASHLGKLEVYAIANCAHQMERGDVAYVETLCNEMDTVAMLGALCPYQDWKDLEGKPIKIEGPVIVQGGKYGHMLNTHYLEGLAHGQYKKSNLHHYLKGRNLLNHSFKSRVK